VTVGALICRSLCRLWRQICGMNEILSVGIDVSKKLGIRQRSRTSLREHSLQLFVLSRHDLAFGTFSPLPESRHLLQFRLLPDKPVCVPFRLLRISSESFVSP